SEMFPLLEQQKPNPVELFQIWLNLPSADKLVTPHFAMLWNHDIPRVVFADDAGRTTEVTVVAGTIEGKRAPSPPPRSWAARADTDVGIWCIRMQPKARWKVPPALGADTNRTFYFFAGPSMRVADHTVTVKTALAVRSYMT